MTIPHEQMIAAGEYAVKLHALDKMGMSEQENDRVKTLLSLGAYRAVEFLNKGQLSTDKGMLISDKGQPACMWGDI